MREKSRCCANCDLFEGYSEEGYRVFVGICHWDGGVCEGDEICEFYFNEKLEGDAGE